MSVVLRRWTVRDLALLYAANTPTMTDHLGGPETEEQVRSRQQRYLDGWLDGTSQMYAVVQTGDNTAVGIIGFWHRTWRDELVYETGWAVLEPHQGQGIAVDAVSLVIKAARSARARRQLHAFPSVDHPASNSICRRAGFTLIGECEFEYPLGIIALSNDWQLDLGDTPTGASQDA